MAEMKQNGPTGQGAELGFIPVALNRMCVGVGIDATISVEGPGGLAHGVGGGRRDERHLFEQLAGKFLCYLSRWGGLVGENEGRHGIWVWHIRSV